MTSHATRLLTMFTLLCIFQCVFPDSGCADKADMRLACLEWREQGQCSNIHVIAQCAATCGKCPDVAAAMAQDTPVLKVCRDLSSGKRCAEKAAARGDSKEAYCMRRWPRLKCQKWCGICTVEAATTDGDNDNAIIPEENGKANIPEDNGKANIPEDNGKANIPEDIGNANIDEETLDYGDYDTLEDNINANIPGVPANIPGVPDSEEYDAGDYEDYANTHGDNTNEDEDPASEEYDAGDYEDYEYR